MDALDVVGHNLCGIWNIVIWNSRAVEASGESGMNVVHARRHS